MCQGLINDIPTVADVVERIVRDAEDVLAGRLAAMVPSDVAA